MQQEASNLLLARRTVGFVPTMGALHEGHLSLVRRSKKENEVTVVSIFVNPTQFGPNEDYTRYPKNLEKDLELLKPLAVDIVFSPEANRMFPPPFQTRVTVEELSKPLCGQSRPLFFRGVATVVLKLFNLVEPTRAYFGEKDYQQLQVVTQMVKDLNLDVEIVPCPIVREEDGLAMSSRNAYLSPSERADATLLYAGLSLGKKAILQGEKNGDTVKKIIESHIQKAGNRIEYVSIVHPKMLTDLKQIDNEALLAVAVWVGKARLIDNLLV